MGIPYRIIHIDDGLRVFVLAFSRLAALCLCSLSRLIFSVVANLGFVCSFYHLFPDIIPPLSPASLECRASLFLFSSLARRRSAHPLALAFISIFPSLVCLYPVLFLVLWTIERHNPTV